MWPGVSGICQHCVFRACPRCACIRALLLLVAGGHSWWAWTPSSVPICLPDNIGLGLPFILLVGCERWQPHPLWTSGWEGC